MHHQPQQPGQEAAELHFAELCHGAVAAHGGHGAEVAVAEGFHLLALGQAAQVLGQQVALLYGHLCQLRVSALPVGVAIGHDALVANAEHAVESRHAVELVHHNAAAASQVLLVKVANGLCSHTAHPDEGACGNAAAVLQVDAMVAEVGHHLVEQHVHTHGAQILLNLGARLLAHGGKQARTGLNQVNVHERCGQVGIVLGQHEVLHLRQCAGYLHTRGAAAHNHHVQQFLPFGVGGAGQGALKVVEQCVAQPHGLAHVLHGHGLLLHVLVAEEVGRSTRGEHQVVVAHLTDGGLNDFVFGEDAAHLRHAVVEVLALLKNLAEGEGNRTRLNAGRGYLIDERWKLVIVVAVDEYDLKVAVPQFVGEFQTTEAAAHYHHALFACIGNIKTHNIYKE